MSIRTVIVFSALSETTTPWRTLAGFALALGRRRAGARPRPAWPAWPAGSGAVRQPSPCAPRRARRLAPRALCCGSARGGAGSARAAAAPSRAARPRDRLRAASSASGTSSAAGSSAAASAPLVWSLFGGSFLGVRVGIFRGWRRGRILRLVSRRTVLGDRTRRPELRRREPLGLRLFAAAPVSRSSLLRPSCVSIPSRTSIPRSLRDRQQPRDVALRRGDPRRCSPARRSNGGSAG